jgi:hypothetical protein
MKIERGPMPGSATIDGEPWIRCVARHEAVCYATKRPILPGVTVYRPMRSTKLRYRRILASYIEEAIHAS